MKTIAATTTRTGLTVSAELDTGDYPKGIKISDREMKDLEQARTCCAATTSTASGTTASSLALLETSVLFICGHLPANPAQVNMRELLQHPDSRSPIVCLIQQARLRGCGFNDDPDSRRISGVVGHAERPDNVAVVSHPIAASSSDWSADRSGGNSGS